MKNSQIYLAFAMAMLWTTACKKEKISESLPEPAQTQTNYADSIYFKIEGTAYQGEGTSSYGVSNGQTNLKAFDNEISGRTYAIATGNRFWYGDVDSTFYGIHHKMNLKNGEAEIIFTQKMLTSKMHKDISLKIYQNNEDFFKVGKRTFATDYEMENSTDGIILTARDGGKYKAPLTSSRPGSSILNRPDIGKEIQKDSRFEIIKTEKLTDRVMLIQATFELNLYDQEGKKYKVTDGFYQKKISRWADNWWQLQVW